MSDFLLDWATADDDGTTTLSDGTSTVNVTVSTPTNCDGDSATAVGEDSTFGASALQPSSGVTSAVTTSISFDQPVENLTFEIFDLDAGDCSWDDKVTVIARDAEGNIVPVTFSDTTGSHQIDGNSIEGEGYHSAGIVGSGEADTVTVSIAGPIVSLELVYEDGDDAFRSGTIGYSDMSFDLSCDPDGIVEGSAGDDVIDAAYTGDPDGDMIDAGDAILPGEAPDDDIVLAGAGNDSVESGLGDDEVYGGSGDDTLDGGVGDDALYGDGTDAFGSASIIFEGEEAGYQNTLGVYYIDPETGELGQVEIAFQNTSSQGSGGYLIPGVSAYNYDNIPAGAEIGIFTISDGDGLNDYDALGPGSYEFRDPATGGPATLDTATPTLVHVATDGTETVISGDIYHTAGFDGHSDLNPDGKDHFTGVSENSDGSVTLGFEDLRIDGDSHDGHHHCGDSEPDYDDAIFTVALAGPDLTFLNAPYDLSTPPETLDEGDDVLTGGEGEDSLYGGGGNDTLDGGEGSDLAEGGEGDDVIDTGAAIPQPDRGYPGLFPADADPFDDRDTVSGGEGNDVIATGDDNDVIDGGAGNDVINAGVDDDIVSGGEGDDLIIASEGSDVVDGGAGNDTVYGGLGPAFPDSLNIRDDQGDLVPDNGMDTIHGGAGDDVIFGEDDDDTLYGDAGNDAIDAGIDDDTVEGGAGNDTIIGGQGADTLLGGDDRDVFLGGNQGDHVDGGSGGDDYDTLDLTGAAEAQNPGGSLNIVYDADPEDGTVYFRDGDGNVTGTMRFEEIENVIPCFTPGTMIATPKGERPVEALREGDKIITRDNGIQEIRWIGQRALNGLDLARAPHLKPILLKKGALGNGLPVRDMLVSPNHRLLVANDRTALYFEEHEVLAAAKHLVNNRGISVQNAPGATYVHFMLDRHEVVLSNGAWTESFQPGDYTLNGMGNAQRNEIYELFPELRTKNGLEDYSAARKTLKRHEAALLLH